MRSDIGRGILLDELRRSIPSDGRVVRVKISMEIAAVVVSLVGAAVSSYFAWKAETRAGRAETAAKNADDRAAREEIRDQERLERERKEAERNRHADLVVELVSSRHGGPGIRELTFHIRNVGFAAAKGINLTLQDDNDEIVSYVKGTAELLDFLTLGAGERTADPIRLFVHYSGDPPDLPQGLVSHVTWRDDAGDQVGRSAVVANVDD
jgi:hypothetical protein